MAGKEKQRKQRNDGLTQARQARSLDALAEFENFETSVLPQLKKAVLENWSPEKMRKVFAPLVQMRMVEQAIKGNFRAMKDILDRHEGMPVQRVEQKTVYAQMDRRELAALALQKLLDAKIVDTTGRLIKNDEES